MVGVEWGILQFEVLAAFLFVYSAIAMRRIGGFKFEVWTAMLLGAVALIALGAMGLEEAIAAVNAEVILFLFGTFLIVEAMVQVGLLQYLAVRFLCLAKTPGRLLLAVITFVGVASAFFVNDAVVLVMTPIVIAACGIARLRKTPYILAVALSSNIGSALTPIGNPQNVLIKIESSVDTLLFMERMAIPVALGCLTEYLVLHFMYRKDMRVGFEMSLPDPEKMLSSKGEAVRVGAVAALTVVGFLSADLIGWPIALVSLVGGTGALLFSRDRRQAIKGVDWGTIVFFASMFVVMAGVEKSGLLYGVIDFFRPTLFSQGSESVASIFGLSLIASQITSNVPFVAIMLPAFKAAGATPSQWISLAAGSTLAGNLTLLGAAANIIVLETAENKGETFSFWEFLKAGAPTAMLTSLIAAVSLSFLL
ncbi:MAG: anion transporter [Candidatus Verstraetearchaeota archaeon]|nr:anion transporter [Candidatus Verstraetearchaeota archaeon]